MILPSLPQGYRWIVKPARNDGHVVIIMLICGPRFLTWLPHWLLLVDQHKQIDTHTLTPKAFEDRVDEITRNMTNDLYRRLNVRGWCKQLVY